jgi:hypothetical protein
MKALQIETVEQYVKTLEHNQRKPTGFSTTCRLV